MKHTVALIPLSTYDQASVDAAVREGVALLGGIVLVVVVVAVVAFLMKR
jgi:hypothetical protein